MNSDQQAHGLEVELSIDRATASRLGITVSQIDSTLYDAFGQRLVSTIYKDTNQYYVVMGVAPQFWQNPDTLKDIYISTSGGPASGTQTSNAVVGTTIVTAAGASAAPPRPRPQKSPPIRCAIFSSTASRPARAARRAAHPFRPRRKRWCRCRPWRITRPATRL